MIINSDNPQPRIVHDYDIILAGGVSTSITVDEGLGDVVDYTNSPLAVVFNLSEKPSVSDPDVKMPPEEVTVYMQHVMLIQKRSRTVIPASVEQRDAFKQTLHKLSGSIN